MLMLLTMVGSGMSVWGNETDKSSFLQSEISNNTLTFTGNHVSIILTGSTSAPLTYGESGHFKLKQECSKNEEVSYTLSITANTGSTAKITAASVWGYGMHAGTARSSTMKWENDAPVSVYGKSGKEVSISNISKDKLILTCKNTANLSKVNFFIDRIRVTYTVTPDTPGLSTTTETIDVTTDTNSPNSVLLTNYFTTNDDFGNHWNFSISQNSNDAGTIANNTFYATKAGTYKVAANIAALNGCHESSAQSADLTIIVNHITGSITATDASTYVNDGMNLSNCVTSSLGTGAITYEVTGANATDATITEEEAFIAKKAGKYTIKATKAQDDQYNTASTTFSVNVSKKDQTLTFTSASYDKNIVLGSTVTGAAAVSSSSKLTNFTYTSSNSNVVSVNDAGDVTGVSLSNDDVTITAFQPGNDEYNPASITRDFHVVSKKEITFIPSGFTGTNPTLHVGDKPSITVENEGEGFTYTSSNSEVVGISKDDNLLTLTALKEGVSTVTLNQPETSTHSAVTQTYTITVKKIANTLQLTLPTQSAQVDGTIQVDTSGRNNTATPIEADITGQSLSSEVNNGENVITYENGIITACNAGTAKITFTQAATDTYEGFTSATFDITVTKIPNPIAITLNGGSATAIKLKYGEKAKLSYSSAHSDADINVTKTSGNYTTLSGTTITAGNAAGTDLYAVTQAETYKYEEGYATFSVRVNNTNEEEGYVLNDATEYSHGTGSGVVHTYALTGPGNMLYYQATREFSAIYYHLYVEYSTDRSTWIQAQDNQDLSTSYKDFSCPIPEEARYVRFRFPDGGTLTKYIRNVKVPRVTYLRASTDDATDFGTVYTDETRRATFTVRYSTTNGGNIMLNSSNAHFAVSTTKLAVSNHSDGTHTFTVTYTPSPDALGAESAVITISDLFYRQQFTLTATANKRKNTLAVIENQSLMVDAEVSPVYSGKNSDATLSHNVSTEGVITYDANTNTVKAVGAGEATLTFIQPENDTHFGTTKSVTFTVSKHNQTLSWDQELSNEKRTLKVGDKLLTNTAKATSGLAVTYSSSNDKVLQVNPTTGEITALAGGSHIAVTATQSGDYKYNEALAITRYFTVISKMDATVVTTLSATQTNTLTLGDEAVSIGSNATLTMENFSISGNEAGYVTTSFADNTLNITPAKVGGTVTITLTRAEDDGYNAVSKTYEINVQGPALTLSQDAMPDVKFPGTEYREVTISRTLPAGLSTIALPFNATVQQIVGDGYDAATDWIAQLSIATYNTHDGWSLYFEKIEKGNMLANQPYILHLGNATTPPVFHQITVEALEAAEHSATGGASGYEGWKMVANYTPHLDMEGKYGVVNAEECLKIGDAGSFLRALTAAIIAPTTVQQEAPRCRFVVSGELNAILEEDAAAATPATEYFDLHGRRITGTTRGIYISRDKNGAVRKVLAR